MTELTVCIAIILGLNGIPLLAKTTFPRVEKVVGRILIAAIILFLIIGILGLNGYSLKGKYTFTILSCLLIASIIAYFVIFTITKWKILTILLLTPLLGVACMSLIFGQLLYERPLDENYRVAVTTGGFLACGELIKITQTRFGIFDQKVFQINDLCLQGITNIETVTFDKKHATILIHHNRHLDSENPYQYKIERNNDW